MWVSGSSVGSSILSSQPSCLTEVIESRESRAYLNLGKKLFDLLLSGVGVRLGGLLEFGDVLSSSASSDLGSTV